MNRKITGIFFEVCVCLQVRRESGKKKIKDLKYLLSDLEILHMVAGKELQLHQWGGGVKV